MRTGRPEFGAPMTRIDGYPHPANGGVRPGFSNFDQERRTFISNVKAPPGFKFRMDDQLTDVWSNLAPLHDLDQGIFGVIVNEVGFIKRAKERHRERGRIKELFHPIRKNIAERN